MFLYWHFFKRIAFAFFFVVAALMCVLSFGNMLTRLTLLPSLSAVPTLIKLMLPLMGVFAVPLASLFAVLFVLGEIFRRREAVMIAFLRNTYHTLLASVLFFSLCVSAIYTPLVFTWAPRSYLEGKRFIVTLARDRINQLEAGIFHTLFSSGVLYFKRKDITSNDGACFHNVFLMYGLGGDTHSVFARTGTLEGDVFVLSEGHTIHRTSGKNYVSSFDATRVDINRLLSSAHEQQKRDPKFLVWGDFTQEALAHKRIAVEYHSRVARILWQLFLPLFALWIMFLRNRMGKSYVLTSVGATTLLFIFSYVSVTVAKQFPGSIAFGWMYGSIFIAAFLVYHWRKRYGLIPPVF